VSTCRIEHRRAIFSHYQRRNGSVRGIHGCIRVNEFESGDWAIGGKALKTTDVQALAAGKAA
jgi:hypothetical protein